MTQSSTNQEARTKQHGEVYTPDSLVNEMLDKIAEYDKKVWKIDNKVLDFSCGDGQFLIWTLAKKIASGHEPLEALKTIYGVDIMRDSIRKCRMRLLKVISLWQDITPEHISTVFQNIVWINIKDHPTGSLEYDFEFNNKPKKPDIDRWMKYIHKDHALDEVELPVSEECFRGHGQEASIFD